MKVIFFDIDGTITDASHRVPFSAIEAIRRTRAKGNKVALCSGRSANQIEPDILAIGFDAIVSAAGANVTVGDERIFSATMDAADYAHLRETLKELVPNYAVQTDGMTYMSREALREMEAYSAKVFGEEPRQLSDEELKDKAEKSVGRTTLIEDYATIPHPQKMFYHNARATVAEVQRALGDRFTVQQLSFGPPNDYAGEITMRGVEKSTGMEQLVRYYGLTGKDTVAIGDGPNDMDMISYAAVGICMGNGREELKRIADYVTGDVSEDGIYQALEHYGLI